LNIFTYFSNIELYMKLCAPTGLALSCLAGCAGLGPV
jgi:hypothetical protein